MKNIVDFTSKIKDKFAMRKDIAPVEESSTASRAYSAGDKFFYGNLLQKAITDIAQGASLVGGTNFENADPVTTTIQNLSNLTINNINKNGSRNLCKSYPKGYAPTDHGITYTVNDDRTITLTGTVTYSSPSTMPSIDMNTGDFVIGEQYVLSGLPSDDSQCFIKLFGNMDIPSPSEISGSTKNLTFTYYGGDLAIALGIRTVGTAGNNRVFKPMICTKSDWDNISHDYVQYAGSNKGLTTDKVGMDLLSEVGAVNFLDNIATSQPIRGIEFTVNADKTVVANGTLESGQTNASLPLASGQVLKAGTYLLRGCPKGGGVDTYRLQLQRKSDYNTIAIDNGDGVIFKLDTDTAIYLAYRIGGNVSNVKCYPMICPISYTGPYVPYAKSNKELTENVGTLNTEVPNKQPKFICSNSNCNSCRITFTNGHGGTNGSRALVFGSGGIIALGFWGGTWQVAWMNLSGEQTVTFSNKDASGITFTFSEPTSVDVLPIYDADGCVITKIT